MTRSRIVGLSLVFLGIFACRVSGAELCSGAPLEVEVRSSDKLLRGHGPSRTIPYEARGQGKVYVYGLSQDLDLWIGVEDAEGKRLAEDDDSGGGTIPHLEVDVAAGDLIRVVVARG